MNTDLSLTIMAICLVILVIFAILAAIYLIQLLIVLKKTTQSVEQKVSPIMDSAKKIAGIAAEATDQMKSHVEITKPLFQAIGKICLTDVFTEKFKKNWPDTSGEVNLAPNQKKIDIGDWVEWVALGVVLIQRLRKK